MKKLSDYASGRRREKAMKTIRQSIAQHVKAGRGKETANRLGFLDACYGRAELSWGEDEDVPIILSGITTKCRHCKEEVLEQDAKVQAAYWTPHHYQMWHNNCHEQHHKIEVIEQQTIDLDCNECVHFEAKEPTDKFGDRRGICKRTGLQTTAYPGGVFCNYPSHDECFEHRKAL